MSTLPPPSGGEANVTQTFFESLPALGYELRLIDTGERDPRFSAGKVSLYNLLRGITHFLKLIIALITFHPFYINLMFSYTSIQKFAIEVIISKIFGVRVIAQMHDPWIDQEYLKCKEWKKKIIRWIFRLPDGWVVLGEIWKKFLIQTSVSVENICVIPNAVKNVFASLAMNNQVPLGSKPPEILFTGTVGYRKGIDILLEALVELEKDDIRFKALIVGSGELPGERDNMISLYQQRLRPENFEFITHKEQSELIALFLEADIFVLPSRAENLPVAMLEAMACGLPVVVSQVGSVAEVITNDQNGMLFKSGDANALKVILISLLGDQSLRIKLGNNARQTILMNHLPSISGNKMQVFMEELGKVN